MGFNADLKDKYVGVQAGSAALGLLKEGGDQEDLAKTFADLQEYADYNTAFAELQAGTVDAVAMDIGVAKYQIESRDDGYEILDEKLNSEQYAIGFKKGNTELRDKVNADIKKLYEDGTVTKLAEKYGIDKVYDQIDDVFSDDEVDIIYISTPHNTHISYLRKALSAGKHVLCEKSITLNAEELEEAVRLAEEHHVVLAEAMTIFHMPIYKELRSRMDTGEFGELRLLQMNFGSYKEYDMKNRFFNRNLAGGALLDIGVYALSFLRWFMSSKPDQILSQVKYAPTGVDEQASILLKNKEEEMAAVILSLHAKQPKRGTISFDKAYIELFEYPRGEEAIITYTEDGHKEVVSVGSTDRALEYEVADMEVAVAGEENRMHLDYTIDVMDMMTSIRKDWGMRYPEEEEG